VDQDISERNQAPIVRNACGNCFVELRQL
jgi:hypothetical protein